MAALGIDCDRLTSGVVILSQTMVVVPFCTIFLLSHWGFIIIADYAAVRFTVMESMLLIIVQLTNDFYLLAL